MAKNKDSNKQKKPRRFWKYFGRTILFLILVLCCVGGFLIGKAYTWIVEAKQDFPLDGQLQVNSLTSYIYDASGKKIDQLTGGEDRDWVNINKIPNMVKNSFIAIEDERFYKHNGIDIYRMFGALWNDIKTGNLNQGGSTITQQYVKTAILNNDTKKFKRKVQEQYLAVQLEKQYTKDQILQSYLNSINLGHGAYGIGAAAKIYFGKTSLKNLTIAEAATIASMPQSPTGLDPYYHFDANHQRQRMVLKKMLEQGYITNSQYNTALNEDIKSELHKLVITKTKHIHSYFVEAVIKEARQKLKEKGMNPNLIYTGGYRIYTTLDQSIQNKLDTNFNKNGLFPSLGVSNGFVQPQASMVILDYHTGEVKALIGGRGEKTANLTFNRAVDSYRQPGSSIKPLAVYGPAIDALGCDEYSTVVDSPFSVGNYTPHNDYQGYKGSLSYKEALTISANIPAVKVLMNVKGTLAYKYLTEKFKLSSIDSKFDQYSASSLALGGLTKGVTVLDMTTAYGIIANKGVYVPSHTFTKILDSDGTVVIDNTPIAEREISEDTAAQLTDMMQNVILHGTAMNAIFKSISMPEAGKTGTTTSTKDKWFIGYTPYYVSGVWMGYDNPTAMDISTNYASIAWKEVMEAVHNDLPTINFFDIPAGINPAKIKMKKKVADKEYVEVEICSESGLKAGQWCPPEDIRSKTFEVGTEPQEYCNVHGPDNNTSVSSQNNSNDTNGKTLDNSPNSSNTGNTDNSDSSPAVTPTPITTPAPQVNNQTVTQTPSSESQSESQSQSPQSQSESTSQ